MILNRDADSIVAHVQGSARIACSVYTYIGVALIGFFRGVNTGESMWSMRVDSAGDKANFEKLLACARTCTSGKAHKRNTWNTRRIALAGDYNVSRGDHFIIPASKRVLNKFG